MTAQWWRLIKGETVTRERLLSVGPPESEFNGLKKAGWWWALEVRPDPAHDPRIQRLGSVTETPDQEGGTLTIAAAIEDIELAAVKRWANDLVNAERAQREGPSTDATVGAATIPVDTRNDRDFRNLLGLALRATLRTIAGDATPFDFKDAANAMHELIPAEMLDLVNGVADGIGAVVGWSWAVKAAIDTAEDAAGVIAELEAEDIQEPAARALDPSAPGRSAGPEQIPAQVPVRRDRDL